MVPSRAFAYHRVLNVGKPFLSQVRCTDATADGDSLPLAANRYTLVEPWPRQQEIRDLTMLITAMREIELSSFAVTNSVRSWRGSASCRNGAAG